MNNASSESQTSLTPHRGLGQVALAVSTALTTVAFGACGVVSLLVADTARARVPAIWLLVVGIVAAMWVVVCQISLRNSKSRTVSEVERLRDALRDQQQKIADQTVSETADGLNQAFGKATDLMHNGRKVGEDGDGFFSNIARAIELLIGHRSRVYVYTPSDTEPDVDEYVDEPSVGDRQVDAYALMFDSHDRAGDDPPNPAHTRDDRSHHLDGVFRTGAAKIVSDTSKPPYRRYFGASKRRTFANVRIETSGRPIGILQVDACSAGVIRDPHLDFIKLVSKFVSVAVELNKLSKSAEQAVVLGQGLGMPSGSFIGGDSDER